MGRKGTGELEELGGVGGLGCGSDESFLGESPMGLLETSLVNLYLRLLSWRECPVT